MAFSQSDVGACHCIAETLGSKYDLPHGVCNAVFLPYIMAYNKAYALEEYSKLAGVWGASFDTPEEGADKAVSMVKELAKTLNLHGFDETGVHKDDFERLAELSVENNSTESNPRSMGKEDYMAVLEQAYQGN